VFIHVAALSGKHVPRFGNVIKDSSMGTALKLAMTKAADLPEAAQEQLGRELLERIEALTQLRADIDIGVRELDAGLGEELDVEKLIGRLHHERARGN
jgi:hypothetical protein